MNTFKAIQRRHGVLDFKPDPVPGETITRILQAAIAAPSPANTQPWEFVVIDEPDLTRAVAEILIKNQEEHVFHRLLEAPADFTEDLIRLYEHLDRAPCFIVICRHQRVDLGPPAYDSLVRDWDLCSLGAVMSNLMLAATALGLGTRWFGNPMMNPEPLKTLLQIPAHIEIIAVTPLGYHQETPKERPTQPLEALVDFKRGDKYKLAALLQGKLPVKTFIHKNRYCP
jgi:nicotinate-nucleotide--dimethylbenzimidazole phosphoribosyltransferase